MLPATAPRELLRFCRTLHIYVETRAIGELLDRIHQYCRCIDGLILPAIGKTKQQFKSRTELFIGPGHHDLMGALYEIRSHVEHLHENRYLETFDRDVRLDLLKKEAIVEYIARTALARIVSQDALWRHFGNTVALEQFWALSADERRKIGATPWTPWCLLQISTRNICTTDISGRPSRLLNNPWGGGLRSDPPAEAAGGGGANPETRNRPRPRLQTGETGFSARLRRDTRGPWCRSHPSRRSGAFDVPIVLRPQSAWPNPSLAGTTPAATRISSYAQQVYSPSRSPG